MIEDWKQWGDRTWSQHRSTIRLEDWHQQEFGSSSNPIIHSKRLSLRLTAEQTLKSALRLSNRLPRTWPQCLIAAFTSSYFLSTSSAMNLASSNCFSRNSSLSSSDEHLLSNALRPLGNQSQQDLQVRYLLLESCGEPTRKDAYSALKKNFV